MMKFSPFQNLYQQLRKTDENLYQALDRIATYLQDLYGTASSTTTSSTSSAGSGKINFPSAVVRAVWDKFTESPSIEDWGAIGDGTTDNSSAIQTAINETKAKGAMLRIPQGRFRHTAPLNWTGAFAIGDSPFVNSSIIEYDGLGNANVATNGSLSLYGVSFRARQQLAWQLSVQAINFTPGGWIQVTFGAAHGLTEFDTIRIAGTPLGQAQEINGIWQVHVVDSFNVQLMGSVGYHSTYTPGIATAYKHAAAGLFMDTCSEWVIANCNFGGGPAIAFGSGILLKASGLGVIDRPAIEFCGNAIWAGQPVFPYGSADVVCSRGNLFANSTVLNAQSIVGWRFVDNYSEWFNQGILFDPQMLPTSISLVQNLWVERNRFLCVNVDGSPAGNVAFPYPLMVRMQGYHAPFNLNIVNAYNVYFIENVLHKDSANLGPGAKTYACEFNSIDTPVDVRAVFQRNRYASSGQNHLDAAIYANVSTIKINTYDETPQRDFLPNGLIIDNTSVQATTPGAGSNNLTFTVGYIARNADVGVIINITGGINVNPGTYIVTAIGVNFWTLAGATTLTTGGGPASGITGSVSIQNLWAPIPVTDGGGIFGSLDLVTSINWPGLNSFAHLVTTASDIDIGGPNAKPGPHGIVFRDTSAARSYQTVRMTKGGQGFVCDNVITYYGYCDIVGTRLTRINGDVFDAGVVGQTVLVLGTAYTCVGFIDANNITLNTSPGTLGYVEYAITILVNQSFSVDASTGNILLLCGAMSFINNGEHSFYFTDPTAPANQKTLRVRSGGGTSRLEYLDDTGVVVLPFFTFGHNNGHVLLGTQVDDNVNTFQIQGDAISYGKPPNIIQARNFPSPGTTGVFTLGPPSGTAPAGFYRVNSRCLCTGTGTGTVTALVQFTDDTATLATFQLFAVGLGAFRNYIGTIFELRSNGSTAITISVTNSGTGTFETDFSLERLA